MADMRRPVLGLGLSVLCGAAAAISMQTKDDPPGKIFSAGSPACSVNHSTGAPATGGGSVHKSTGQQTASALGSLGVPAQLVYEAQVWLAAPVTQAQGQTQRAASLGTSANVQRQAVPNVYAPVPIGICIRAGLKNLSTTTAWTQPVSIRLTDSRGVRWNPQERIPPVPGGSAFGGLDPNPHSANNRETWGSHQFALVPAPWSSIAPGQTRFGAAYCLANKDWRQRPKFVLQAIGAQDTVISASAPCWVGNWTELQAPPSGPSGGIGVSSARPLVQGAAVAAPRAASAAVGASGPQ